MVEKDGKWLIDKISKENRFSNIGNNQTIGEIRLLLK